MFNLSKKTRICRYYNEDLWGELRTKKSLTATFIHFLKQFKERKAPLSLFSKSTLRSQRRKSIYGNLVSTRKKLSLYYGGLQTGLPAWSPSPERMLHLFANSVNNWERRLTSVVYRSGFSTSILGAIGLVISGGVTVNRKVIVSTFALVEVGDVVEVVEPRKKLVYGHLINTYLTSAPVVTPRYLEISFCALVSVLIRVPLLQEVYYPFGRVL